MQCVSFFFRIFAPSMQKFLLYTTCFFVLSLLFSSCEDERTRIPFCQVDIRTVQGMDTWVLFPGQMKTFNEGERPGGWAGCRGVVVINLNNEDFLAFDMACPNCVWVGGATVVEWQLLAQPMPNYFHCTMCNTRFNPLDGRPMQGAETPYTMRQYRVTRLSEWELHIHN